MKEIDLIRTLQGFRPAGPFDARLCEAYKVGARVTAKVRQRRKLPPHSLYWVCLNVLITRTAAGNDYPDAERLHKALLASTGYVDEVYDMMGRKLLIPSSTAFNKMDEAEAHEYRQRAFALIEQRYGVGIDDLLAEADAERRAA